MPTYSAKSGRERLVKIENSWQANAAGDKFADVALTEITADIAAEDAKADQLADARALVKRLLVEQKDLTKANMKKADYVVRAVEGDRRYGPDSALYAGFGYIRESEKKKSGGRKKTTATK